MWGSISKDEWHYQWRFKDELEQILPATLSISDVQTSNRYIITIRISINIYQVVHLMIKQISVTWVPSMGTLLKCNIDIETERQKT